MSNPGETAKPRSPPIPIPKHIRLRSLSKESIKTNFNFPRHVTLNRSTLKPVRRRSNLRVDRR